jgi:hypothetical protein
MSTIEVWLNEKSVAVGGGHDFEVLTLGVLGNMASGPATAQLTGWRKSTGEHFQWFCIQLRRQDKVRAVFRKQGTPTPAIISGAVKENWAPMSSESNAIDRSPAELHPSSSFRMTLGTQVIRASAHTSLLLQATATWHRSYENLKVEIGCVANEKSEGHFWVETWAECDEFVEIEIR